MDLPVYKLTIQDEDFESGVDFISLVENPAIQKDFMKFEAFESYSDYPESVKNNAQKVLNYTEENGWGSCGTDVGKQRANQLAKGEAISVETIQRMYSYLSRHKVDLQSSKSYEDGCGLLMYDSWGGEEALSWSERKLQEIEKLSLSQQFAIQSEEKRIISGAAMLADLPIYRRDAQRGEYYVVFDKETIFKIAKKWAITNKYNSVNVDHAQVVNGLVLFESYLIDVERGIMPPKGFEDAKDGSWFVSYYVENEEIWQSIKDGVWKGFSVEGFFDFVEPSEEDKIIEALKSLLSQWNGK